MHFSIIHIFHSALQPCIRFLHSQHPLFTLGLRPSLSLQGSHRDFTPLSGKTNRSGVFAGEHLKIKNKKSPPNLLLSLFPMCIFLTVCYFCRKRLDAVSLRKHSNNHICWRSAKIEEGVCVFHFETERECRGVYLRRKSHLTMAEKRNTRPFPLTAGMLSPLCFYFLQAMEFWH